ncbi:MAG: M20/M25/M40 family metallo-hydrolase [Planctomycetaceae bacterium]|nr:M20/M25/M40 family metallo-hydrolase [Planctomycetaceae bacterium]
MKRTTDGGLPAIREKEALALVTEMMAVPGKSCEEGLIATHIRKRLKAIGIPDAAVSVDAVHKQSPYGGTQGNVIVKLPGTIKAPRRLLMSHIDTVPLCVGCKPVKKGERIVSKDPKTALGADNRAGASVLLNTLIEIQRQKLPHPPLTIFWPVQEEIGLVGARYVSLSKLGSPKLCYNWDGGDPNAATIGATGGYDIDIWIHGIASHAGAHPEAGVSAAAVAGIAIADLVKNGWHGLVVKGNKTGTSNIGIVQGGDATNVVLPELKIAAEARSHDPIFRKQIMEAMRAAFEKAVTEVKSVTGATAKLVFEADLKYESFKLDENEPAVKSALAAIEAIGMPASTRITNGGLDANWLSARGLPTVTLGCGQENAHTVDEALHIEKFLAACRIGLLLATGAV